MEFEELKGVRALNALFFAITIAPFVLIELFTDTAAMLN